MRLDLALVERGLARSRSHARQLIDAGKVTVTGAALVKAALPVREDTTIDVDVDPYVSRAAYKLTAALESTGLIVTGRVLDAGASTGGFTQVVLERGAEMVYAVDVGHGQMATPIRDDPRVVLREGLNLRDLSLGDVGGEPVDLVVADVSFISLTLILGRLFAVLRPDGVALVLVKPQFEVGRAGLDSHGVVADRVASLQAVERVVRCAENLGWALTWSAPSILPGQAGNVEFFCLFRRGSGPEAGH